MATFQDYQGQMKAFEAANRGTSHMEYNSPSGWGAGWEQGPGTEVWDTRPTSTDPYNDWMATLSPAQQAEYRTLDNQHFAASNKKSAMTMAALGAAGLGGIAALGPGVAGLGSFSGTILSGLGGAGALGAAGTGAGETAAAAGATSYPVNSVLPFLSDIGLDGMGPTSIASGWGNAPGWGGVIGGGAEAAGAVGDAATSATWGSGAGLGRDTLSAVGANSGRSAGSLLSSLGGWPGVGSLVNTAGQLGGALSGSRRLAELGKGTPAQQTANSQLDILLKDPSSITKMPGYEAGLQAVQRTGAAQGYLGSGNMMIGLDKYGGDFYNNTVRQLAGIGQSNAGVNAEYTIGGLQLFGQGMNSLGGYLTKFGDGLPSLFSALGIGD